MRFCRLLVISEANERFIDRQNFLLERVLTFPRKMGVENAEFREQRLVAPRLSSLPLEAPDLAFHFAHHVVETQEIGLGEFQFPQGFLLLRLVFGDARRLLENGAAFLGSGAEDLVDLALFHDGIGAAADACIHEKQMDVAESAGCFIEEIFGASVAENPARDADFVVVEPEFRLAFGEGHRDFGHAHGLTRIGAGKDDVGHFTAAQCLGRLLAEHPANGVEDVRFSTAVRADDCRHSAMKFDQCPVGERLEALNFEGLEIHRES